jgi:hypothetical protein
MSPFKPFFSEPLNDWVVDEQCECGHLKSEHGSLLTPLDAAHTLRQSHDGSCCSCSCGRFTFVAHTTAAEYAEIVKRKRVA